MFEKGKIVTKNTIVSENMTVVLRGSEMPGTVNNEVLIMANPLHQELHKILEALSEIYPTSMLEWIRESVYDVYNITENTNIKWQ
ncbi:MAG: hypothetical protein V3V59_01530 [Thermodesulfovibrionales bacterium]